MANDMDPPKESVEDLLREILERLDLLIEVVRYK